VKSVFRPWQLAVALAVVCGIAVGIAIYVRRPVEIPPRQQVAYMPHPDSTLMYVDLGAIRDSGLLERLAGSAIGEDEEYKTFVARTAFDYKTDLDSVLASTYQDTTYLLLRGRFQWKQIIAYATSQGGTCRTGFCRVPGSKPNRIISFRAITPSVMALAVGPDEWAAATIKPAVAKAAVVEVPTQPIWAIIPGSSLQSRENVPTGTKLFAKALENTDRVVLTLGPEQDRFQIDMDAICKTESDAVVLRSTLESVTQLLQKLINRESQKPNPGDLSGILVQGSFTRVDRHVMGKWPVPREFMDSLAGGG
jgi:hypothetical protein